MNEDKWHPSDIRIAINAKSQGSIATNLRCAELLHYAFVFVLQQTYPHMSASPSKNAQKLQ